MLKETLPNATRVGAVPGRIQPWPARQAASAARVLGIELERIELSDNYDIDAAFALAEQGKCAATFMLLSPRSLCGVWNSNLSR